MSLQRRLLLYLAAGASLVLAVALFFSILSTREEVDELFDTELIRLARQVQATLVVGEPVGLAELPRPPHEGAPDAGAADLGDLAIAAWRSDGRRVIFNEDGDDLPYLPEARGFVDTQIAGSAWRLYYQESADSSWLVAVGQEVEERDEMVYGFTLSQMLPWLLVLPVLLGVMAWAVRRALAPVHQLAAELAGRAALDLQPVADARVPAELKPMLAAMNGLFARIEALLLRERRFTADAAHELRTPLAVLGAQWDVVRHAGTPEERRLAEQQFGAGLERMGRLVTQMLALSRIESGTMPAQRWPIDWPAIVEQAMNDCLALAERRQIELACEWPPDGGPPLPLQGDPHLLTVLMRNLLDNAVRYAPEGSSVLLCIGRAHLEVENDGPALAPEQFARLGERFYRPDGQQETGSGLGLSIVRRIARLHGLDLVLAPNARGQGLRALLQPISAP